MKSMKDRVVSGEIQTGRDTAVYAEARKLIAIIEDDVHIGDIIEESLRREGYQTCRAYSGTEALYLLADENIGKRLNLLSDESAGKKPDLILLDLMLPGLAGEALLPQIRDTPVIVISAKVGVDDKVEALLGGAADYITKPFVMKELLARITVQLRKTDASVKAAQMEDAYQYQKDPNGTKLAVGNLVLDLVLREISSTKFTSAAPVHTQPAADADINGKDRTVRLTRTEFAILRFLMRNAGQVFSKAAILDCISGDTPDCTDSSLKQHISNLRKKLAEIGEGDCIEAVWGIGFRFRL